MTDEILQNAEAIDVLLRDAATSASRPGDMLPSKAPDRSKDPAMDVCRDLMIGAGAIAAFMGMSRRQLYHAAEHGHLPTFKIGALVCARRTTLIHWLEIAEGKGPFGADDPSAS